MLTNIEAAKVVNDFQDTYKGAKNLNFIIEKTPELVYGRAAIERGINDIKGAYHPKSNIVVLFSQNATSKEDFIKTIKHEVLGHYALNTLPPSQKKSLLTSISSSQEEPTLKESWKKINKSYPELSKSEKAEEVYAIIAENTTENPEIVPASLRGGFQFNGKSISKEKLRVFSKTLAKGIKENSRTQQTFPKSDNAQFQKKSFVKKSAPAKLPFHEQVANKLIQQLKEGAAPWQKPWDKSHSLPLNPTTGAAYKGSNSLWLEMQGRSDPRWMTYKQAQDNSAQVRKGEKGTTIQYWKFHEERIKKDANSKPIRDSEGKVVKVSVQLERPKVFSATVFNAEQIEGLPELKNSELKWNPNERAEKILRNSNVKIEHKLQNKAYYNMETDSIHLPNKEQFPNQERYYTTALHELAHATGAPHRLSRDMSGDKHSESYAREELRADIASHLTAKEIGIPSDSQQNVAYVKHWIKLLNDDPKEILRACRDAEKASKLILSYEQEKTIKIGENKPTNTPLKQAEAFANDFKNDGDKNRFLSAVQERLNQKPTLSAKSPVKTEEEAER